MDCKLKKTYRFYATPYNGTLFVTGGRGEGSGASADRAETLFLSLDGTIKNGPNLPTTRRDHCSVELHDGRLVVRTIFRQKKGRKYWHCIDSKVMNSKNPVTWPFLI